MRDKFFDYDLTFDQSKQLREELYKQGFPVLALPGESTRPRSIPQVIKGSVQPTAKQLANARVILKAYFSNKMDRNVPVNTASLLGAPFFERGKRIDGVLNHKDNPMVKFIDRSLKDVNFLRDPNSKIFRAGSRFQLDTFINGFGYKHRNSGYSQISYTRDGFAMRHRLIYAGPAENIILQFLNYKYVNFLDNNIYKFNPNELLPEGSYVANDFSKYDTTIPKWFIEEFYRFFSDHTEIPYKSLQHLIDIQMIFQDPIPSDVKYIETFDDISKFENYHDSSSPWPFMKQFLQPQFEAHKKSKRDSLEAIKRLRSLKKINITDKEYLTETGFTGLSSGVFSTTTIGKLFPIYLLLESGIDIYDAVEQKGDRGLRFYNTGDDMLTHSLNEKLSRSFSNKFSDVAAENGMKVTEEEHPMYRGMILKVLASQEPLVNHRYTSGNIKPIARPSSFLKKLSPERGVTTKMFPSLGMQDSYKLTLVRENQAEMLKIVNAFAKEYKPISEIINSLSRYDSTRIISVDGMRVIDDPTYIYKTDLDISDLDVSVVYLSVSPDTQNRILMNYYKEKRRNV